MRGCGAFTSRAPWDCKGTKVEMRLFSLICVHMDGDTCPSGPELLICVYTCVGRCVSVEVRSPQLLSSTSELQFSFQYLSLPELAAHC